MYLNAFYALIELIILYGIFLLFKNAFLFSYRSKLFKHRNDLIILFHKYKVDYNHKSYLMLEERINALIRFTHLLSLLDIVLLFLFDKNPNSNENSFDLEFERTVKTIPNKKLRKKILEINSEIDLDTVRIVFFISPIFWVSLIPLGILLFIEYNIKTPNVFFDKLSKRKEGSKVLNEINHLSFC